MKKLYHSTWLVLCLFLCGQINAQYTYDGAGPLGFTSGIFQYTGTSSVTTGFTNLHINTAGGTGNTWSSPYAMPFAFDLYGTPVTHFIVSKNFLLSFDTTNKATAVNALIADNTALPNSNLPDKTICYNWDLFSNGAATLPSGDNVMVGLFGTAPNRQLWIKNFSYATGGNSFSYTHLVLEETTNKIFVIDWQNITLNGGTRTIGVQLNSTTASFITGSPNIGALVTGSNQADLKYYELTPRFLVNNNVGVSAINSPTAPLSTGSQNVNITLTNYGINSVDSAIVNWSVNGVTQTPLNFGGTLAVDADTLLTIGTYNFTGKSDIKVWSSAPNGNVDAEQSNDTSMVTLKLPLSGAYTINSLAVVSPTNYQNFTTLLNDINSFGISGSVTINVVSGSGPYLEQAVLGNIIGSSSTNTIEINGNGNTLMYAPNSTDKRIVGFNGSKYIKLKNLIIEGLDLTNGFGIHMMNNSSHIIIDSCTINLSAITSATTNSAGILSSNDVTSTTLSGRNANNITVSNSTIFGGTGAGMYYGIRFNGSSATVQDSSIRIINNVVADFYNSGIYLADIKKSYIEKNNIHRANKITVTTFAGITTSGGCESDTINANSIHDSHGAASSLTGTSYGIFNTSNDAGASTPNLWLNNLIYNINSNGTTYAIYNVGSDNQYYIHNTVSLDDAASTTGVARGFFQTTAATGIIFQNNNISITRGGSGIKHGLYFGTATSTITSNYNNVYVNSLGSGAQSFGYENATTRALLSDWQLSSYGANSISADPTFINSSSDLTPGTPALNNVGLNLGVPSDFYGNPRGATPDIGAIEFVPPSCLLPSNLSTDSIAGNALKVSWTESGTSTKWEVVYGVTGFTLGSTAGTSNIVTIDTFKLLTSLTPFTTYDYYVRSICSTNDTSLFLGPQTVTTGTPLSGAYTINSTAISGGTNFQNFTSFTNALNSFGVSGPVTVNVVSGSGPYLEQVIFTDILGSSSTNTIEINGNGNELIFAPNSTDRRVVGFNGSKYIKIKKLNITGIDLTYGFGIHMMNQTSNIVIDSCTIDLTANTSTTSTNSAGITSSGTIASNATAGQNASFITVSNTKILGGTGGGLHYGMRFNGTSAAIQDSVIRLLNNEVADFYSYGIYLDDIKKSYVEGNDIHRLTKISVTTLYGIYTTGGCENDTINANSIHDLFASSSSLTGSAYGIYNSSNDASASAPNLWLNNIIYNINSNGLTYAIYNSGSDNQYYIHNTISLDDASATAGSTRGFYQLTSATGIIIQNNNISITKGGSGIKYGLYFATAASTITSNYNNIYLNSAGTGAQHIGYLTTNRTTLADWQTAGFGANSITAEPFFTNVSNNLTPSSASLNNAGVNLGVPSDFYGNARGTTPDIGAIEFTPPTCVLPSGQSTDGMTTTSTTLVWKENGTATQWQVVYGLTGFTLGSTAGTSAFVNTDTFKLITGLAANTTYDWYVRAICGSMDTSSFSGPSSFYTGYCQVVSTSALSFINDFTTSGGVMNISNTGSGYATSGYQDATSMVVSQFASASVTFNTALTGTTVGVNVWIDWNNDLDFNDLGEKVYASGTYVSAATGTITVPASTPLGNYRMRIRCDYNAIDPASCGASGSGRNETEDYTFSVVNPPACLAPTAQALDSIASTAAKVYWTENGTATQWEIEYGVTGFTLGSTAGTSTIVNTDTFKVITGLTANTTYDWYVRAVCGSMDTSSFAGPSNFFTGYCQVSTTNSGDYISSLVSSGANTNISYTATSNPAGSYSDQTAQILTSFPTGTFDITSTYVGGANGVNVWVDWNNDLVFDNVTELIGYQVSAAAAKTISGAIPATAAIGNYRMRVRAQWGSAANPPACGSVNYGTTVDLTVAVTAPPTCLAPSAQSLDSIAPTSAKVSWTENGTATQWEIEYDTAGFAIGTGRFSAVVNTTTYRVLTGLTANTTYDWYVKAICSPTTQSTFTGSSSFTTSCNAVSVFPFFENFETTSSPNLPNCWSNQLISGTTNWKTTTGSGGDISAPYAGTNWLEKDYNNSESILYSPAFDLTAVGTNSRLNVWLHRHVSADVNDQYIILINNSKSLTGADTLLSLYSKTTIAPTVAATGWYNYNINIPSTYNTSTVAYIMFVGKTSAGFSSYDLGIDNYTVEAIPACLAPSAQSLDSIASTAAKISWTENGTATQWEIEYDTAGFAIGTGRFSAVVNTNTFRVLTGLTANTNYQWYVKAICSPTAQSTFAGPSNFFTGYCQVSTTNSGDYISSLVSSGANTNISYTATSNPAGSYSDQTAQILTSFPTGTFDITSTYVGGSNGVNVWVDWNNDLVFDNVTELIGYQVSAAAAKTISGAIPATAAIGNYRMRVRAQWGSTANPPACGSVNYGTTVDFTVAVTAPPACLAPSALSLDSIAPTAAKVSWTENGTATQWEIEYGVTGFILGSTAGTSAIVNTDTFKVITGLTANTTYDWYVRAICGAMDSSLWSTASSFTTPCAAFIAPYFDNVEAHTATTSLTTSMCWTATDNNSSINDWNITGTGTTPSGGTGPLTAYSGSKFFYFEASGGAAGNRASLTSPLVNISGLTVPSLEFYYHMFGNGLAVMADLYIEVYNGTSFVIVDSIKGEQQLTQADPFKKKLINLAGFSGTIQVKFTAVRNGVQYGDISIDDIRIAELPNCFAPSALVVSAITTSSATISWNGNNIPVSPTYQISYGPLGFTAGSGLKYTSSTNSYAITGLNSSTPYDVYVRSICNVGDTSVWSIARSFTTSCAAFTAPFLETFNGTTTPTCWSQSAVLDGPWVFGGPGFTWNTQGCPFIPTDHTGNSGKFAALDFSGTGVTDVVLEMPEVNVSALTDPQLEFYFAMCGTGYTPINILYVDAFDGTTWNNVGLIQRQTNGWEKFTFKLGAFKYNTNIVRVRFRASSGANTASMFQGDQAIDDVAIVQAPADNLAVSAIVNPVGGCGQTATSNVTITIDNVGSAAQSGFGVGYSINGVAITPEIHTASIAANSSANYTFTTTANLSASGNYQIVAYTMLTGDVNMQNDTNRKAVTSLGSANSFPYAESFENGAAGWVADGNANSTWALGTPAGVVINSASNGTKAWATNLTGDYLDGGVGSVNSPCFDFTNVANPAITLDIWYDIESFWDGAIMQTSTDNGATWNLVGAKNDPINWYNDTAAVIATLGLDPQGQAWTGDTSQGNNGSNGWIKASHYLNGMGGLSNVRVRILFAADGGTVAEGFAFDNVRVFDSVPVVTLPYYPIGIVNTENSTTGIADSLGVFCWISGTVAGVDLDGNVGLSFTIIDQSGTNPEGMNIYNFADVSNYVVTEGDSIMLRGEIQQFNGLTELFPDSIRIIATGKTLPAHTLVSSLSEATESQLIEIRDFVVITGSGNGSYNMTATNGTDTLTIRVDADTDVNDSLSVAGRALVAGDTICSLKGIGGQFDNSSPYLSGYQIFPMRFSDIDTTSCLTIIGIKDADENTSSIQFYPNPNNGQFKLQIVNVTAPNSTLEIVNIQGQVVYNENLIINGSLSKVININVEKGIYFVKLSNKSGVKVEKLIIE